MAGRRYCKNTVKGSRRGQKYPPKVRAEVLMAMLSSGSICAVAPRYGVPESTIRSWMAGATPLQKSGRLLRGRSPSGPASVRGRR